MSDNLERLRRAAEAVDSAYGDVQADVTHLFDALSNIIDDEYSSPETARNAMGESNYQYLKSHGWFKGWEGGAHAPR